MSVFLFFYLTKSVYGRASSRGFNLRRLEIQPGETKIVYPRGYGSKRRCRGEKRNPDERLERSRLVPMRQNLNCVPVKGKRSMSCIQRRRHIYLAPATLLHTRGLRQIPYIGLGSCGTAERPTTEVIETQPSHIALFSLSC